jgi:TRAP-type C4-dicarboxylate transport system substrate-binding protein
MVNSVITSSASGKDGKFWEVLNNFTKINYAYPLQAVTINLDYWNSLSKDQKNAMLKAADEIEKSQWKASKEENKIAIETLRKNGMVVSEASPKLKAELDKIANDLLEKYLDGANSQIKNIFKEYRK